MAKYGCNYRTYVHIWLKPYDRPMVSHKPSITYVHTVVLLFLLKSETGKYKPSMCHGVVKMCH